MTDGYFRKVIVVFFMIIPKNTSKEVEVFLGIKLYFIHQLAPILLFELEGLLVYT